MEGPSKKAAAYSPTGAVPSALTGLTSLFGMVRGEPRCHDHPKLISLKGPLLGRGFRGGYLDILEKNHMNLKLSLHKEQPYNKPTGH